MAKKSSKAAAEQDQLSVLKQDLKSGAFRRLYLFHGEEHYLRDHYLQMLRSKLLDGPAEEFNYHRFTQENMSMQALSEAVEAMPMMAQATLVQVDDCELSRLTEHDRELLTAILSDIPEYCTVVFVFGTVEFKYDSRWKKLKEALEAGLAVEFRQQSVRELTAWVRRHFQTADKEISDRDCEHLIFITGGSMAALSAEIGKISAYASDRTVTQQDINAVVTPVLEAELFDLTDAMAEGDYEKALIKVRTLVQLQQEPILLLAAMGSQLRRLLYARICMSAGKGEGALTELLKQSMGRSPHPIMVQKTMTTARRVSDRFCTEAVRLCMQTDEQLKGSGGSELRVLELLLIRLAQEARRG